MTLPSPAIRPADLALAERCAGGDRAAQEQLFDEQRERVHRILYRILGSNREIEDLVQEAFVAVFRSLGSYRGEASLPTWVDRITTRTAFKFLSRSVGNPVRLELVRPEPTANEQDLEQTVHSREAARRLYSVLDRLRPKYRLAYVLHVIDGRPMAEAATLMEISLVAAKNRIWRARRMVERHAQNDSVLRDFLSPQKGSGP